MLESTPVSAKFKRGPVRIAAFNELMLGRHGRIARRSLVGGFLRFLVGTSNEERKVHSIIKWWGMG